MKNLRVAIIGPESSGKSTLAKALNNKLNWPIINEYAREYFAKNDYSKHDINDLIEIAKHQYSNSHSIPLQKTLISDTDIITIEIWAEDKFSFIPNEISELRKLQKFDIYILSLPDFKWVYDKLRTDSGRQEIIYNKYLEFLLSNKLEFIMVKGSIEERLNKCLNYFSNY